MRITFKDHEIPLKEGQTVLDALLEEGQSIPYACKQGVCQSCVLKTVSGDVPKASQVGLKSTQQEQGYFLSCLCHPQNDLEIAECDDQGLKTTASLVFLKKLSPSTYVLRLKVEGDFSYKAGQYINLTRPSDQLTRSYSIASVQERDGSEVELHVKVFPGGEMSNWLSHLSENETVDVRGPMGDCFYSSTFGKNDLLLLGYGTGLAPLYGILQDALMQGHSGKIYLYHWGNSLEDLYYQDKISALIQEHSHIFYRSGFEGSVDDHPFDAEYHLSGDVCAMIQKEIPSLKDWKIFLCGGEAKVNKARRVFYLAGADLSDIYADAFFTWQKDTADAADKVS